MELDLEKIPKIEYFQKSPKSRCTERHIRLRFPELYNELLKYNGCKKFTERLYRYYHNVNENPTCPICGKPVSFWNFIDGYSTYCSLKCSYKSEERAEKFKQSCMGIYGVPNPSYSEECKQKRRNTTKEHYGVEYSLASPEVRERGKKTMLEKYGVEYSSQSDEIKEKVKATTREHYGVDWSLASPEVREKGKKTMLEKYGYICSMQSPEFIERIKQTCLERYGVDWSSRCPEIQNKKVETCLKKYGCKHAIESKEVKEKIKNTMLNKYGVESISELWNLDDDKCNDIINQLKEQIKTNIYKSKKQNHSFNSSKLEENFSKWLEENKIEYKSQYRCEEYPFNCDFYFPKTNTYLEIQGYFTHGKHPFNPNNPDDIKELEKLKKKEFHENIHTWTVRDPLKRQWAKDHNLNWHEVFTNDLNDLIEWCKSQNIL